MTTGRQLKDMINAHIDDDDIVCLGEKGDEYGRHDSQIIGIERRWIGFHDSYSYKAIVGVPYETHGALKFWDTER